MRLLITGGAGFIGSNLALLALNRGHEVTVIDDLSTGYESNIRDIDVEFVHASILDVKRLAAAATGVDSIVHLAALGSVPRSIVDPISTHTVNATGTLTVLETARAVGVDHVLVASSSSVYGMNPALPKGERDWVRPMSPYAVSKLTAEQYSLAYQQSFGMKTTAFRFFNVYGPRQRAGHPYAAVIPVFIEALLSHRTLPINGDGSNSRDFTYVGTVCNVLMDATERRLSHAEPVNLAFSTQTTLLELVKQIEDATGLEAELRFRDARPGDVRHSQADHAVLRSLFPGIQPVPLGQGLSETVDWFKEVRS